MRFRGLIVLTFLLLSLPMAGKKKRTEVPVLVRHELSSAQARRLTYFYLEANRQKMLGNVSAALDLYQHCLEISPDDAEALFDMGIIRNFMRQDSVGMECLRRATENAPGNPWYLETYAAMLLRANRIEEATPVLEKLSHLQSNRTDVLGQLAEIYKNSGKAQEAIDVIGRMELLEGRSLDLSLQKFSLYASMNKIDKAFGELLSLEKDYPHDLRIKLQLASKYLVVDENAKASAYIEKVKAVDPYDSSLQMVLMEYYANVGQDSLRTHLCDSLLYSPYTEANVRLATLRVKAYDNRDVDNQDSLMGCVLDSLARVVPRDPLVLRLRAAYIVDSKVPNAEKAEVLRQLLAVEPDNDTALRQLLFLYLKDSDYESLVDVCRMGANEVPEQLMYHFYLGMGLYQLDRTEECVEAFRNGLNQVNEESQPSMVSDLWALLGDALHELGHKEECYAAYDSCLVYKDDNASCLNNYAYYLCLEGSDLARAEEMSYRSIKLEPSNKTYLDTYAWILYCRGQYTDARYYIDMVVNPEASDEALRNSDQHAEVIMHAAMIYEKNEMMEQSARYKQIAKEKEEDEK